MEFVHCCKIFPGRGGWNTNSSLGEETEALLKKSLCHDNDPKDSSRLKIMFCPDVFRDVQMSSVLSRCFQCFPNVFRAVQISSELSKCLQGCPDIFRDILALYNLK
ncbi:hypothetical protein BsWGS_05281 [Bradybaena similaris]